jgi:hypothetical protein
MNKKICIILIFGLLCGNIFAQTKFLWKAGLHNFFDNNEFSGSAYQISQTMAGTHIVPQAGISFLKIHKIFVGADLMHEWGSKKIVDFADVIAYYQFDNKPFRFYAGLIPRKEILNKYPKMFFQDSIQNYRPTITGVFWEFQKKGGYLNVWLDWTSHQTDLYYEKFFMGWSARGNLYCFYAQHFGYMFHHASRKNQQENLPVNDNGLILTSLGVDFAKKAGFDQLETNLGWSVGLERNRGEGFWHTPQGLLWETKIEFRGLELFNSFYYGKGQQVFFRQFGGELYWGDKIYRSNQYNRLDFKIHFAKNSVVNVHFTYSFHFLEKRIYSQQILCATFDLDNFTNRKSEKKYRFLWEKWFVKK